MPSRALPCGCAGSPGSIGRCDSNSPSPVPAPDRPLPLCQNLLAHSSSQPVVLQTGSPLFCVDLFENVNLHGLVGHQTLKPRVLFLQRSEPLGFADFHPSELPLPRMVGRRTDVMRRADRLYRAPGLRFSQYPNDLFLAESTSLHVLLLLSSRTSLMSRPPFGGQAKLTSSESDRNLPFERKSPLLSVSDYSS